MPEWYGGSTLNPDEIEEPRNQWMAQFYRMGRWYERVLSLKNKSKTEKLDSYDFDTLIAFFQNCFHLRDWLKSARPELRDKIKILFKDSFELQGCRDICHGFKHKKLNDPSLDADFNLYLEYDPFAATAEPKKNPEIYNVAFADGKDIRKFNVFDLADKCVGIWIKFLQKHNLIGTKDT